MVAFEEDYTYTIKAEHIIIATGGFGANRAYKAEIGIPEPFATQRGTTNNPGNQGDGHKMAKKAGAELIRMADHWNVTFASSNPELAKILQPNTSANVNGTFLSLSSALYQGGIIVGSDGRRITAYPKDGSGIVGNDNSVGTLLSDHVTAYNRYWPDDNYAFLVIGHKAFSNLGNMRQYYNSGLVFRGNTPEELAQIINIDPAGLKNTIAGVRDSVDGTNNATTPQPQGSIDNMRWPAWWKDEPGPYYAARVNPSTHGTFGGIWINANMQALDVRGEVIPGLFAVGVCSNTYSSQSSPSVHNNCAFGYAAANYILTGRGSDLWWNN
jgi:fumarate reductase flavoprotein subunit